MHLNFEVPDYKRVRVILDTDCACEADDPFAVAYALMSPKLIVKGIIAEHFNEPGSMQASYDAILKLTNAMHLNPNVLHGEEIPLCAARPASEGVQFIIASKKATWGRTFFGTILRTRYNPSRNPGQSL